MTTHQPPADNPRTARTTRLRALAAATALVPLLVLGACTSETPVTANPSRAGAATAPAPGTEAGTATESSSVPTPTESATPTTQAPMEQPTKTAVKVTVKDPVLGHVITISEVRRNLPWPKGNPVGEQTFEIVGLKVKSAAGTRYSAPLSPNQLTLRHGATDAGSTTEFGSTFGKLVRTVQRGGTSSGWIIFKIEKGIHPLVLEYHRPAYKVSTTDKTIKAVDLSRKLVD